MATLQFALPFNQSPTIDVRAYVCVCVRVCNDAMCLSVQWRFVCNITHPAYKLFGSVGSFPFDARFAIVFVTMKNVVSK